MSTNVKPDELNYDHYEMEKYDKDIIGSIPGHEEMHRKIEEISERDFKHRSIRVLELGIGTGLTAIRILRDTNCLRYVGVDFSEKMLQGAKRKLRGYNVKYILGDFSKVRLPRNNDLVVSVIGIHHQETDQDKKAVFRRVFDSLSRGGAFIFGDLVTWRDKNVAALNDAGHYHHLVEESSDEVTLREWAYHHKVLNKLAPLEDQVEWLREVGFYQVDVIYTKFNTALIYARKNEPLKINSQ